MTKRRKRTSTRATRIEACRLAAQAAQGQCGEGPVAQRLWSLCVFFENYIDEGSHGTCDDFGYKEPVTLREVKP